MRSESRRSPVPEYRRALLFGLNPLYLKLAFRQKF